MQQKDVIDPVCCVIRLHRYRNIIARAQICPCKIMPLIAGNAYFLTQPNFTFGISDPSAPALTSRECYDAEMSNSRYATSSGGDEPWG